MPDTPLQGKVAVITGAGRGIGQAIAIAYARAGAAVCCGARTTAQLDATVKAITSSGGRAIGVATDVTDYASVDSLFARAATVFGGVDIVVAAAGVPGENKPVEESDPAAWTVAIDVNLTGSFHTAKAAIPRLRGRPGAKIILVGSGMGHRGAPTRSAYAASKAGLWMLTRVLAQEIAAGGICVNELVPGPVVTAFIAGREGQVRSGTGELEWFKQPEDVAPLALFLACQPDKGPTGQSFSLARREL
ncbi:MAG TPA: SDR family oxidoreductase [Casimicrobiaceae bacterium]|nr:SDR family oxidoreductase [Casimicrobiaceae bacterium]